MMTNVTRYPAVECEYWDSYFRRRFASIRVKGLLETYHPSDDDDDYLRLLKEKTLSE